MRFLNWIFIGFLVFSLTGCFEFENLEFHGIEKVQMPKMDDHEILIDLSIKVENPNKFNIKLKPSQVAVFLNEKKLGTIHIDEKLKFLKKVENVYSTQLKIKLEDGAFFSLLKMATKDEIPLRFKGKIKGSVFGISKKIEVDQVKKFSPKDLNFLKKP
jgi:LEA14-like dessication related protein